MQVWVCQEGEGQVAAALLTSDLHPSALEVVVEVVMGNLHPAQHTG